MTDADHKIQNAFEAGESRVAEPERRVAELEAERDRLETALGSVYYHLTDGKLSKPYDFTPEMEAEIEDAIQARMKSVLAQSRQRIADLEAERDRLAEISRKDTQRFADVADIMRRLRTELDEARADLARSRALADRLASIVQRVAEATWIADGSPQLLADARAALSPSRR